MRLKGSDGRWISQPVQERFWEKVNKSGECWLWTCPPNNKGYGLFFDGEKTVFAHRYAYRLQYGPIPKGMCVLHHCDTPLCVRHIYLGDRAQNARDMVERNRVDRTPNLNPAKGEGHGRHKLTASQVAELRSLVGIRQRDIGKMFGISQAQVGRIYYARNVGSPSNLIEERNEYDRTG